MSSWRLWKISEGTFYLFISLSFIVTSFNLAPYSKWIIYVISCPICNLQYVGQSNNFRARMNGHKSDFRLYAAGKINKMDNKLLYDHLICHNIDYFHVSIVDMIEVGNNTESQLDELLSRKERKWICDLCSITPYGLNQDDRYYCQNKRCRKR